MLVAAAMSAPTAGAQTGVTRVKRGDTTVVVTQGNGRWGPPHDAIEVLRVPGDTRETTFGVVNELTATADGGVVVVDRKSQDGLIVRQFDANGKFVRNVGRSGSGPGEYNDLGVTVAAHRDGSIYVRDATTSVSVFRPDGRLVNSFPLPHNRLSTNEITAAPDGSVYVRAENAESFPAANALQRPMVHYDIAGKLLDSVSVTARWLPEDAPGVQWWRLMSDGRLLFTRTDKVAFMIVGRDGKAPLVAEVPAPPVPYLREEREELQAARDLVRDKCSAPGRPRVLIPEAKLPARSASIDIDGRIWIAKSATGAKIPPKYGGGCSGPGVGGSFRAYLTYEDPPVMAAFLPDGTYLGEVRFPVRARVTFVGRTAWAVVPDADDVPVLVKYRLY